MANYPTSASTDANLHVAVNSLATAIVGALTSVGGNNGADIEVVSTTNFPSAGYITIDTEAIRYTSILSGPPRFSGITRGADGTTAAAHSAGAACKHNIIAAHHNAPKDEIIAIENDLIAAKGALNDADTPAATASDVKDRLDHIVTELKRITQNTNWYDAVDVALKDIAGNTFVGVGRNRIHNGAVRIDQINSGSSSDASNGVTGTGPDGIYTVVTNSTAVVRTAVHVDTPPDGFTHYMRFTCITADASIAASDQVFFDRNLEGSMVSDMNFGQSTAKTVTFSFYVRSTLTGTYTGAFSNSAQNRSYPFEYTINSANTWERKTITFVADTTGTWLRDIQLGLRIRMAMAIGTTFQGTANTWASAQYLGTANQVNFVSSNSSRTLDFSGFQLEIGSVVTPFEHRPYAVDLAMCQRYLWVDGFDSTGNGIQNAFGVGKADSTTSGSVMTRFPVTMRAAPTVTFGTASTYQVINASNSGNPALTAIALDFANHDMARITWTVASGMAAGNGTFLTRANGNTTARIIYYGGV